MKKILFIFLSFFAFNQVAFADYVLNCEYLIQISGSDYVKYKFEYDGNSLHRYAVKGEYVEGLTYKFKELTYGYGENKNEIYNFLLYNKDEELTKSTWPNKVIDNSVDSAGTVSDVIDTAYTNKACPSAAFDYNEGSISFINSTSSAPGDSYVTSPKPSGSEGEEPNDPSNPDNPGGETTNPPVLVQECISTAKGTDFNHDVNVKLETYSDGQRSIKVYFTISDEEFSDSKSYTDGQSLTFQISTINNNVYSFTISKEDLAILFEDYDSSTHKFSCYEKELYIISQSSANNFVISTQPANDKNGDLNLDIDIPFGDVNCNSYLGNPKINNTPAYYLQFAFDLIKYIAIILLLVLTIVDFAKAVINGKNPEEMKKALNNSIKRLIIAVVIFFLPILIKFVLTLAGIYSPSTCDIR